MTTRRQLIKTSLSLAAVPIGMSVAIEVAHAEDMPQWDKETDVLVLGYGNAGSNAAIVAADAGAKVLIWRKQLPEEETYLSPPVGLSFRQTRKTIISSKKRCMNCLALSGTRTFWIFSAKSLFIWATMFLRWLRKERSVFTVMQVIKTCRVQTV